MGASKNRQITTIYMDKTQAIALKRLSERTKVPGAVYIRDGINKVLDENLEILEKKPEPAPLK